MTADELARSYFSRARKRLAALRALMQEEAFPDVVREAQELVELALKGMLRWVGIDPPKWHDVGSILKEHRVRGHTGRHDPERALAHRVAENNQLG